MQMNVGEDLKNEILHEAMRLVNYYYFLLLSTFVTHDKFKQIMWWLFRSALNFWNFKEVLSLKYDCLQKGVGRKELLAKVHKKSLQRNFLYTPLQENDGPSLRV